jgi:hypothetical protein
MGVVLLAGATWHRMMSGRKANRRTVATPTLTSAARPTHSQGTSHLKGKSQEDFLVSLDRAGCKRLTKIFFQFEDLTKVREVEGKRITKNENLPTVEKPNIRLPFLPFFYHYHN